VSVWGQIAGGVVGLVIGWFIIWVTYRFRLLSLARRDRVPEPLPDERYVTEDPYARYADTMPPEMLADLRARWDSSRTCVRNLDGVSWHDAPIPKKRHRCWVQTWGTINWFDDVYRCPCGASARAGRGGWGWVEKNTRTPKEETVGAG